MKRRTHFWILKWFRGGTELIQTHSSEPSPPSQHAATSYSKCAGDTGSRCTSFPCQGACGFKASSPSFIHSVLPSFPPSIRPTFRPSVLSYLISFLSLLSFLPPGTSFLLALSSCLPSYLLHLNVLSSFLPPMSFPATTFLKKQARGLGGEWNRDHQRHHRHPCSCWRER